MDVQGLIDLLKKENPKTAIKEVLSQPAFKAVRRAVTASKTKDERNRSAKRSLVLCDRDLLFSKEVGKLCQKWVEQPEAFLNTWSISLPGSSAQVQEQVCVREVPQSPETCAMITPIHELPLGDEPNCRGQAKRALWVALKQLRKSESQKTEGSIRWIMFTVALRDAMVPQAEYRRHLPVRGLIELVAQMWKNLTDEILTHEIQQEIVRYVKEGQLYSVIGDFVGEGVWLLLPTQTMDKRWGRVKASKANFAVLEEAFNKLEQPQAASNAAIAIREFLSRQCSQRTGKRKTEDSYASQPQKIARLITKDCLNHSSSSTVRVITGPSRSHEDCDRVDFETASNDSTTWTARSNIDHSSEIASNSVTTRDLPPVNQPMWDHSFLTPSHDVRRSSTVDHCQSVDTIEPIVHMVPSPGSDIWNSVFSFGDAAQLYGSGTQRPESSVEGYAALNEVPVVTNDCFGAMRQDIWGSVFSEALPFSA